MRTYLFTLLLLIAAAIGSAFYFGVCTIAADREEKTYVVRLVVHPDVLVPGHAEEAAPNDGGESSLEAKGKIASINTTKNEFVLTENFKNLTFRVSNDTNLVLNGQSARLADLSGGDDAKVVYTRQGQQLNANVVRCTRKAPDQ